MMSIKYSTILKRASLSLRPSVTITNKRLAGGSAVHDDDPVVLETEKRRNLSKQQHHTSTTHEELAPGWNEYLASTSEAHIKADRLGPDGPPTVELTERTLKHVRKRHYGDGFHGSSREEASYERDEVEGPLKTSSTGGMENSSYENMSKLKGKATPNEGTVKTKRGEV